MCPNNNNSNSKNNKGNNGIVEFQAKKRDQSRLNKLSMLIKDQKKLKVL